MENFGCFCVAGFIYALVVSWFFFLGDALNEGFMESSCRENNNVSECVMIYVPNTEEEIIRRYEFVAGETP